MARLGAASRNRTFYRTLLFLLTVPVCYAILVNRTIDSNNGDPVTGFVPIYQPQSPWADQTCGGCYIQPDTTKAFDGTWNAATYHPDLQNVNLTLQFTGVAVWVFFILPNANIHGFGTTTNTQVNITLDGQSAGTFSHNPDLTTLDLIYNATIFSTSGLANTPHELVIATNNYPISTFINFDWAIYSVEEDAPVPASQSQSTPSSTSPSTTTATTAVQVSSSTNPSSVHSTSTSSPTSTNRTSSTTLGGQASAPQSASSSISTVSVASSSTTDPSSTVSTSSPTPTLRRSSSKIAVIVGCIIGGLAVIALVLVFLVRRLRRAPPAGYERPTETLDNGVPSPLPLNGQPNTPVLEHELNQSKMARLQEAHQMEIDERIQSVQREMDSLNMVQNASSAGEMDGSSAAGTLQPAPELASLRYEMQQLREQIGHLQAQRETDWVLDSSNEPLPPAYTRH